VTGQTNLQAAKAADPYGGKQFGGARSKQGVPAHGSPDTASKETGFTLSGRPPHVHGNFPVEMNTQEMVE
jgi:hypothetical protein